MNQSDNRRGRAAQPLSKNLEGHNLDVEFSEERADQEDWEALERSERADARQNNKTSKL
ncbi:YfhD family protein [Paenibacillus pinistramenti]|uniref:YfhD family protein n=1 Tax=Paenibacillus pinistramenti TaxID=1768003 RepID=UPI0011087531|nr:YfhD family protein [Paenibacillus pinistramenti]